MKNNKIRLAVIGLVISFVGCMHMVVSSDRYREKFDSHIEPIEVDKNIKILVGTMDTLARKCYEDLKRTDIEQWRNSQGGGADFKDEHSYKITTTWASDTKASVQIAVKTVAHGSFGQHSDMDTFLAIADFEVIDKSKTKMVRYYKEKLMGTALENWATGKSEACPKVYRHNVW